MQSIDSMVYLTSLRLQPAELAMRSVKSRVELSDDSEEL